MPLSSNTSLRARTFIRNVRGVGHNSTVGVTLPEVWAQSVPCVARGEPCKAFLALGMDKANPRVSATSSIVRAYKRYTFFYGIIPFARVPDPEVTLTFGLFFALS